MTDKYTASLSSNSMLPSSASQDGTSGPSSISIFPLAFWDKNRMPLLHSPSNGLHKWLGRSESHKRKDLLWLQVGGRQNGQVTPISKDRVTMTSGKNKVLYIIYLHSKGRSAVRFQLQPLYLHGKRSRYPLAGTSVGPGLCLGVVTGSKTYVIAGDWTPVVQSVASSFIWNC
jgi:hypothetical protein